MAEQRPKPDDFEEVFQHLTKEQLLRHYNTSDRTLARWLQGRPARGRVPVYRPVPDDFLEIAPTMTAYNLRLHYKTSDTIISRWFTETGIRNPRKYCVPPPADFAQVAPGMTAAAMRKHYRVGWSTIRRWASETGVSPMTPPPPVAPPPPKRAVRLIPPRGRGNTIALTRVGTIYDDAADILRRNGPVYRCTETGKADPKGKFWRIGWSVLTGEELLARAERYRAKAA